VYQEIRSSEFLSRCKKTLVFLSFFLLLLSWFLPISMMNPVPLNPVHSGQLVPLSETPVYLKSEVISANISDIVRERTEYVLQNSENMSINLSIALPFSSGDIYGYQLPANVTLTINGSLGAYIWSTFNYTDSHGYNRTCYAIVFNLTFVAFEEKIIVANYSRVFWASTGLRVYNYITETAGFWNRSIEQAQFNYRLDSWIGSISISGLEGYSSHRERTDLIINKEFYDWSPTENIRITFDLGGSPNNPFSWFIIVILLYALIVITTLYLNIRRRKKTSHKSSIMLFLIRSSFHRIKGPYLFQ
jgi:hypothetical protein